MTMLNAYQMRCLVIFKLVEGLSSFKKFKCQGSYYIHLTPVIGINVAGGMVRWKDLLHFLSKKEESHALDGVNVHNTY